MRYFLRARTRSFSPRRLRIELCCGCSGPYSWLPASESCSSARRPLSSYFETLLMPDSDPVSCDATIDWELEVTDSPFLLTLAYVFPSILGGVVVLAGVLLTWILLQAVLTGNFARVVGLVVIALLGLLTRRYLPTLLATNVTDPFWDRYSRRGLAVGSVLGAIILYGSVRLHPNLPFVVFVASWIPLVLTAGFPTDGHANLEKETL